MGHLETFHRKVSEELARIKEAIASENLDALLGHGHWYDYCFPSSMEEHTAYHISVFPHAEAVILGNPYTIYEDDDLIDALIESCKPKECYGNALLVSASINADYVEGYIVRADGSFLTRHAWNKNEDGYLDITGEGQDKFNWTELGSQTFPGELRRPFRETHVYIALETLSAQRAVSEWERLADDIGLAGGSLCLAQWLSKQSNSAQGS